MGRREKREVRERKEKTDRGRGGRRERTLFFFFYSWGILVPLHLFPFAKKIKLEPRKK